MALASPAVTPTVGRAEVRRCGLCGAVEGNPDVPLAPVRLSWATAEGRRGIELMLCEGCVRDVLRRASRDGAPVASSRSARPASG